MHSWICYTDLLLVQLKSVCVQVKTYCKEGEVSFSSFSSKHHLTFSWISFMCWNQLDGGIERNRYRLFLVSTVAFNTLEAWDSKLMVWSRAPLSLTVSQDVGDACEQCPSMAVLACTISKWVLILSKQSTTELFCVALLVHECLNEGVVISSMLHILCIVRILCVIYLCTCLHRWLRA